MLKKTILFFKSYAAMALFSLIYIAAIAMATFIDSYKDTISAKVVIYNNIWFILLQILMVVNFLAISIRRKLFKQRKYGAILLHYGLIVILLGALTTHLFGREGVMTVREGESSSTMLSSSTYITATVERDSGESETMSKKVNYGELVKDNFSFVFDSPKCDKICVSFHSFMTTTTQSVLNVEVKCGENSQIISLEGGRYQLSEAATFNIEGSLLSLQYGSILEELPFTLRLIDFNLTRYPGSASPSSYSSDVEIEYRGLKKRENIYMNNIARVAGYKIYQTSYDKDEKGTILTVNYDVWGATISYIGYLMLAIGLVSSIFHRKSRFSWLLRRLSKVSTALIILLMLCCSNSFAQQSSDVIDRDLSDKFSHLLVQNPNGRVEPYSSYALKMVRKLHRSSTFNNLTANQFLLGVTTDPLLWGDINFIYIGNSELAQELNAESGKYISYNSLFNSETGEYILAQNVRNIHAKEVQKQSKYEKELLKLDEKANILNSLFLGEMLPMFPIKNDPQSRWLSRGDELSLIENRKDSLFITSITSLFVTAVKNGEKERGEEIIEMIREYQRLNGDSEHLISERKISWELFYNRFNIFKHSGISYLSIGSILLIMMLISLLRGEYSKYIKRAIATLTGVLILSFIWHTFGIALRWYISGRAPWTNSYESMIYVAWSAILLGLIFYRRSKSAFAISALMGGAIIMISQLNLIDPEITPLVPVLKSYWLMFHVATITASYGFFGVGALIGVAVMVIYSFTPKDRYLLKIEELTIINELSLTLGLILLSIGIFIGAIWANESWGRYWGWDPKESWALITMVLYAFVLHARFIPSMRSKYIFNLLSIYSFFAILMTFFGVNYFLSGMHSYGKVDSLSVTPFLLSAGVVMLLTIFAERNSD